MDNLERAELIFAALQNYLACHSNLKRFYRYELMATIEETFYKTEIQGYASIAKNRCCPSSSNESLHVNYEATIHLVILIGSANQLLPEELFFNWWWHDFLNFGSSSNCKKTTLQ